MLESAQSGADNHLVIYGLQLPWCKQEWGAWPFGLALAAANWSTDWNCPFLLAVLKIYQTNLLQ